MASFLARTAFFSCLSLNSNTSSRFFPGHPVGDSQGRTCGSVDAGRECVIGLLGATTGLLAGRTNLWWRSRRECVVGLLGANMGLLRW
jgi:hypothetical protein